MPPSTLNELVNNYNDGFLLNYFDPREHARSISPLHWALRATAPTDHNLAQKIVDTEENDSSTAFTLPKYLNDKHQIALDASGLEEMNQQYFDFGWAKKQRNKTAPLIVFVISLLLCIGVTIPNNTPLDDLSVLPPEMKVMTAVDIDAKNKHAMNEAVIPKKAVMFDFINDYSAADSNGDKPNPSNSSSKPTPSATKIVEDTSNQIPKSEDTPASEERKAKQKPNILRTVKHMIRSAICALRKKSGMKCEYNAME